MKGKIEKFKGFWGDRAYRIYYDQERYGSEEANVRHLDIRPEDMSEFMDDIFSSWMKLDNKTEIVERRATEAVKARKELHQCEKEEAYREGYDRGYKQALLDVKDIASSKKEVITKQEEAEQDRDEQERDKLLIEKYKTYNNPFPTDEALDFDVNIRERV